MTVFTLDVFTSILYFCFLVSILGFFVLVKSFHKKNKEFKTALITSLYLHFVATLYLSFFFILFFLHFVSRLLYHVTDSPPWLHRPVKASTSSELYPDYFWLPFLFHLPWALRFRVDIFYPQKFFTLCSFSTFLAQPAFIKASLGAGSSSLKFAGLHTDLQNTGPAHLFVWFTVIYNLYTS